MYVLVDNNDSDRIVATADFDIWGEFNTPLNMTVHELLVSFPIHPNYGRIGPPGAYFWNAGDPQPDFAIDPTKTEKAMIDNDQWANDEVLTAFAEIIIDEINVLRQQHSLADRTLAQLKTAIKNRVKAKQ